LFGIERSEIPDFGQAFCGSKKVVDNGFGAGYSASMINKISK